MEGKIELITNENSVIHFDFLRTIQSKTSNIPTERYWN